MDECKKCKFVSFEDREGRHVFPNYASMSDYLAPPAPVRP